MPRNSRVSSDATAQSPALEAPVVDAQHDQADIVEAQVVVLGQVEDAVGAGVAPDAFHLVARGGAQRGQRRARGRRLGGGRQGVQREVGSVPALAREQVGRFAGEFARVGFDEALQRLLERVGRGQLLMHLKGTADHVGAVQRALGHGQEAGVGRARAVEHGPVHAHAQQGLVRQHAGRRMACR